MSDLKQQAEELGIKVDGRWSDERIQQEIDTKLSEPGRDPLDHDGNGKKGGSVARTYAYRISRDYWDEKGKRHRKGKIVEMTADDAQDGLEAGALTRVKD